MFSPVLINQALLLNSFNFSKYQSISLAALEVKCTLILAFLPYTLLISGYYLLRTPNNGLETKI